ncbi:hypothetical protein [Pararcticibacter amylolyticus]|uniref:ApeA N-terminal domain-containing protein n=1 Tax=Pararcticibacter amylolyticus TaxID=2173175 RepID=A0A2U2P9K5_9SPHI|nr:hypothetical protein [Pararcticibacter amylolyticus]PWG78050.1 hypothetical protein DDR33_24230 [Pararcticibacter amylolyticus]
MKIYLRYIAKPNGSDNVQVSVNSDRVITFQLEDTKITVTKDRYVFQLEKTIELDENEINELKDLEKFYENGAVSYKIAEPLFDKMKQIVEYLKFFYGISELDENFTSNGVPEWSEDGVAWNKIPMKYRATWKPSGPVYYLPESLLPWLPLIAKKGIKPFFAFNHLHKAFNEFNTRHQWINATICAELAFKEFLATYDDKCVSLITYAPSPPLPILYKQVLFEQTGEKSPFAKELGDGATIRNNLIHKPKYPSPSKDETNEYLHVVQSAILHLQYLLYKDIPVFEFFFKRSLSQLARIRNDKK